MERSNQVTRTAEEIRQWLIERVSTLTGVPKNEVDPTAPLTRYGLDSVALISLTADFEKWLGYRFKENPLDRHPTIDALADYLQNQGGS
jgi:acyl carrier protein